MEDRIRLDGLVPQPIVTEEEYEWVQQRLLENQQFSPKNTKLHDYLLRGLIRCSLCGRTYVGVTRRDRAGEYICGGR